MITASTYLADEISRLEENMLKFSPYRGWYITTVTFPSNANTDVDIPHTLSVSNPEAVQYQVLQSAQPVIVYHDTSPTRVAWSQGLIRLRCTSPNAKVVVLLTTTDAPAITNPGPQFNEFRFPISNAGGIGGTNYWGTVGSTTWLDSYVGPGFGIQGYDSTTFSWQMGLRQNAPFDQGLFFADTIGMAPFGAAVPLYIRRFGANYHIQHGSASGAIGGMYLGNPAVGERWHNVYTQAIDVSGTAAVSNIQFPAVQVSSSNVNNLDDYEEGTWTPVFTSDGGGAAVYSTQVGFYTKIGNLVKISCTITTVNLGTLAAGRLRISGLPFALDTTNAFNYNPLSSGWYSVGTAMSWIQAYVDPGTPTQIALTFTGAPAGSGTIFDATNLAAASFLMVGGVYNAVT
jgi:hypothetical protein